MIYLKSTNEIAMSIAKRAKNKRLQLNLSQNTLSTHSGVSYSTLKKFEASGKISLESLIKIALALGDLDEFENLFANTTKKNVSSIDELFEKESRKRGRK